MSSDNRVQGIKNSTSLLDIAYRLGDKPRKVGSSYFIRCPFHSETGLSCRLNSRFFYCFGCNASGDLITFVEKRLRVTSHDAIKYITKLNEEVSRNYTL